MRPTISIAVAILVLLGTGHGAAAQRSDAADRGQRLDSDALRNDIAQDRLKKPATPFPWWSTAPSEPDTKGMKKSGRKK